VYPFQKNRSTVAKRREIDETINTIVDSNCCRKSQFFLEDDEPLLTMRGSHTA
jgi:hypothetical protein